MYTIKKVGQVKDVNTKNGIKQTKSFVLKGDFKGVEAENWASFWVNPKVSEWKEGDEIECNVVSREYNGKTYWNGELPKLPAGYSFKPEVEEAIMRIDRNVQSLLRKVCVEEDSYPMPTRGEDNPLI